MSKKYKGKICVYCQRRPSIRQGDHVFSREFFLIAERGNLIKVPACDECNNEKSKIEHYLTALLPFSGRHQDAKEHLSKLVPQRLAKNKKLKRRLRSEMKYIWCKNDQGVIERRLIIPFAGEYYTNLFKYITKALAWHYWGTLLTKDCFVYSTALTSAGSVAFDKYFFSLQAKNRVENVIGNRTVEYLGVQATDNDYITIWKFRMFNGLVVSNSEDEGSIKSSSIGVISGPRSYEQNIVKLFEE